MQNSLDLPKRLPLTILLIGTSLLAIPGIGMTLMLIVVLFDSARDRLTLAMMLFAPIAGFALLFGYIRAFKSKEYNPVFWLLSTLYNLTISGFILYLLLSESISSSGEMDQILKNVWGNPLYPFLLWTMFVTIASGYYCKFAYANKKYVVPVTKAAAINEEPSSFTP
ncbi:MAG: hypothetical protein M3T96_02295 [Acidobacteriota bacterium]|nr:hypothetical protein [Acidobacteriota bacterium]